jgi:DNA-binding HxlR family transcriptional regulator
MPRTAHKDETPRSRCPVSGALDLIGDRWTLLVVRDLFWGKARFGEFEASPEGIPTNILAARLQKLERAGLVGRKLYQDNPPRYSYFLTPKGRSLGPVLSCLVTWGKRNIPGTRTLDELARAQRSTRAERSASAA